MRTPRLLMGCVLAGLSIFLMSAKCIENDTVRRGSEDDDWHIYGEMHNETDIQGAQMFLQGTLLNADGSSLTSARVATCPRELSPGSLSVFDVRFEGSSALQEPTGHKVNVASGKALDQPLPKLNLISSGTATKTLSTLEVIIKYRNSEPQAAPLSMCLAMYDAGGSVVQMYPGGSFTIFLGPAKVDADSASALTLPATSLAVEATQIRYWIWLLGPDAAAGGDPPSSDHQAFVSDLIPIAQEIKLVPKPGG